MSRKQKVWVLVVFLLVLLGALFANLPALQLLRVVQLPPQLQIAGVSGSVVQTNIAYLQYQQFSMRDVDLQWQPLCLFKAAICYGVMSDDKALSANLQFSPLSRRVTLSDSRMTLDSRLLQQASALLVKPRGVFDIKLQQLSMQNAKLQALQGQVDWLDAGMEGEDQTLGNYRAEILSSDDGIKINLSDQQGLLKLQGDIQLQWSGDYNIDVSLEARPGLKPSIKAAVELMAQKTGLDRYRVRQKGRLNPRQTNWLQALH